MFRIGLPEILVILVVVVIFVNPKEFPGFFRKVGKFVQQMRDMRDAFKSSLDEVKATINTSMTESRPVEQDGDSTVNRNKKDPSPPNPSPVP